MNDSSAYISFLQPASTFTCNICLKEFVSDVELFNHFTHHENMLDPNPIIDESDGKLTKEFYSQLSDRSCKSTSHKVLNQNTEYSNVDLNILNACSMCKKIFKSHSSLKRHQKFAHLSKKPYMCTVCHRRFLQLSLLSTHSLLHQRIKRKEYKCQICEKTFSKSKIFQKHIFLSHTCQDKHFCYACCNFFSDKEHLTQHIKNHLVSEAYGCNKCEKQYKTESALKKHRCFNDGLRPYLCKMCGKRFIRLYHLKRHSTLHAKTTEFMRSKKSNPDYSKDSNLADLIETDFPDLFLKENEAEDLYDINKRFECYICNKRWFSLKKYKEHFLTVHKEVNFNACHICSKQFTKTSLVKRHLIIHSKEKEFKCDTCYKTFSTNYNETACRETCQ